MPRSSRGKAPEEKEGERGREPPANQMEKHADDIHRDSDGSGQHSKGLSLNPEELPKNPSPVQYARDGSHDHTVERLNEGNIINSTIPEDINSLRNKPASRRSRNFSPGSNGTRNKKPALLCDFYAKGWCVKGNSCKFLHQKNSGISSDGYKEMTGTSSNSVLYHPASFTESKESFSTMFKPPVSSHANRSTDLQRFLVQAYGRHDHNNPQISDNHDYSLRRTCDFSYSDRLPSTLESGYWQNNAPEYGRSKLMGFSREPSFSAWQSSLPLDGSRKPDVPPQYFYPETAPENQYDQSAEFPNAGTTPLGSENLTRERDSLMQKDDIGQVSYLPDGRNLKKAEHTNSRDGENKDKDKDNEESLALNCFRAYLINYIKEQMKPFWKDGRITKDEYKSIVKKIVEKVLGTIEESHIPRNIESANQYISISRSKLLKLVEGYVLKYEMTRSMSPR